MCHERLAHFTRTGNSDTPENTAIVAKLLGPGGMYVTHFYKGLGLKREAEEMDRGLALAAEMRRRGMGVCL